MNGTVVAGGRSGLLCLVLSFWLVLVNLRVTDAADHTQKLYVLAQNCQLLGVAGHTGHLS